MENRTVEERLSLVANEEKISIRKQCDLLSVSRSSFYYKPLSESDLNMELMKQIDKIHLKYPSFGIRRITNELEELGYYVNRKRVGRLMKLMGIEAIYPKRNLSKLGKAKYIHPYLLRGLKFTHRNQVWEIDISYVPMEKGFMYLTVVIDVYSRFVVGWQLSNSLEKETQTELINSLISKYGKPEIINSDQGSQYTSSNWIECLKSHGVKISMDGKGRATDNIYVERFFRTIKYDYIYLNPAKTGLDLYQGIKEFMIGYNKRKHQGINEQKPNKLFSFENENNLSVA
ncbi:MAG: IS3 family transposase [Moheibacter sp.]